MQGMRLRITALVVGVWLAAGQLANDAQGQDEPVGDDRAVIEAPAGEIAAPPATDVELIDRVPNHLEVLRNQWSADLPEDVSAAERSVEGFGHLVDTVPKEVVSLQECIGLALKYNTQLQIQRLGPVNAAAGVRQARSIFDPAAFADVNKNRSVIPAESISIFTSGGSSDTFIFNQNFNANIGLRKTLLSGGQAQILWQNNRNRANPSVVNQLDPEYNSDVGLSLNQPLLRDFGWKYSLLRVEVAQNIEASAYYRYRAVIADIITQVETVYWNLVLALQSIDVSEQGLALARETLRQNEGKFNVGALAQTSVLEARAEVARREANLLEVQNAAKNSQDTLRAIINAPDPSGDALLRIEPQERPLVTPYTIDLQHSLQVALEERPELVAARLDIRGSGLQRRVAENQLLPRLNFVGALGLNGASGTATPPFTNDGQTISQANPGITGGYGRALELVPDGRYYNYFAGATVEVPLDNARAKADYAQANIAFEQSRLSLRQLEESVTLEIKQAVNNLVTDLKSIDATRLARELEEENLRNQQARYDVGLATTKDLLDFQERLTISRFREIQALTQYNTNLARMRRVEGSLLTARNVFVERPETEPAPWWASF